MPNLNDVINEVRTLSHDLQNRVTDIDKEQKTLREELTSKTGAMPAEYKGAIDGLNERINELMDAFNAAKIEAARPRSGEKQSKRSRQHEVFMKCLRAGGNINLLNAEEKAEIVPAFMPTERKALYAGDATTGGFFAGHDFISELQQYQLLISPMRRICRVQKTSGEKVLMPALANDTTAYWATEQSSYSDSTDPTLAMLNIPVHEMRGLLKISQQNLEDSEFNLESFMKERLTLKFAQTEGTAFISGNGNGKPRGLFSYPIKASSSYSGGSAAKANVTDAIPYVPSTVAANITADSVLNVKMDLKAVYDRNATYVFTRGTLNTIRLFKDSMNRPLWQPFAGSNLPATIYDSPYVEMPDMDEIAANKYPIAVGDFSNYMIVDRVTLSMTQLNELFAIQGLVGFIARVRVGGDVLLPESFRFLKCAVS